MIHRFPSIPDFSNLSFLITGGAGFIGSHVCDFLIESNAKRILVLDNLTTGNKSNIESHIISKSIEFIEGDICDYESCLDAGKSIDVVIHLAALGSVPRSVANPLPSHAANSTGFLNMLWASKENQVQKFIYASSSSVYGDNTTSPKVEGNEGNPLSPYAVTKQNNEAYAKLFFQLYGLQTIGLRFFNIFGTRQNKDGPYAAFLPLVIAAAKSSEPVKVFGDGLQSRDFTYIANAVWGISSSILAQKEASGKAFNIGCGHSSSLIEVIKCVEEISGNNLAIDFMPERSGDIKNSLADLTSSALLLGYKPIYSLKEGLALAF